jgi:DNA-binding SARP family transcriptional activator/Tfp pilus assembly protein PilF
MKDYAVDEHSGQYTPTFRVLGPVEITTEKGTRRFTAPRQRVVLAVLLLRANRFVSLHDLIDAVYGESPPSTARSQIQICVSRLRRDIASLTDTEIIFTRPEGYICHVAERDLDVALFEKHVQRANAQAKSGKDSETAADYRRALSLWRGRVLQGAGGKAQLLAESLEERRISSLVACIELELNLGRHRELISELIQLVSEYPLRETFRGYLMVALYRSGRQADALAVYRKARKEFIEELGIEPSKSLREIENAILSGGEQMGCLEPSPDEQPESQDATYQVVPHQLPPDIADFTGRGIAVATVLQLLGTNQENDTHSRSLRIVSISGRGGIGKTTLAVHVAHQLNDSYPDGQLFACLHGNSAHSADLAEILRRFLRGTGLPSAALPTSIDDLQDLYRSRLGGKKVLVVLDDVGDESHLAPLLPGSSTCSVIVTSRRRLGNVPGAHRVDLDVLDSMHARQLLARLVGAARADAEPDSLQELVRLCGHWPLAIRIVGARLAARKHWSLSSMVDRLKHKQRRLDEMEYDGLHIRSSIAISYDSLSTTAQRLFRMLSLCKAMDFAAWTAAALLDMDCADAEDLLDELVQARLVDVAELQTDGLLRYRYHDLVRLFAEEEHASTESANQQESALLRLIGAFLALARDAHRRIYGGDFTVLHGNGTLWRLPDIIVDRILADPMGWFEAERDGLVAAIQQSADIGADELCWDLALTSVTLFEARDFVEDWQETHERALHAVLQAGNKRGEAAMLCSLGSLHQTTADHLCTNELDKALELFEDLQDLHGQALTLRNLAFIDRTAGRLERALDRYERAITSFQEVNDTVAQAHGLVGLAQVHLDLRRFPEAERALDDSLGLCVRTGNKRVEAQVWQRLGDLYLSQDQLENAKNAFESALRLVNSMKDRVGEVFALCGLGVTYTRQQNLGEAEKLLQRALEMCGMVSAHLGEGRVLLALGWLHVARQELDSADEYLRQASDLFDKLDATLWHARALDSLAEVRMQADQRQDAEALWQRALDLLASTASPEVGRIAQRARGLPPETLG